MLKVVNIIKYLVFWLCSGDSDLDGGGGGGGGGEMEQVPPHISSWRRREVSGCGLAHGEAGVLS